MSQWRTLKMCIISYYANHFEHETSKGNNDILTEKPTDIFQCQEWEIKVFGFYEQPDNKPCKRTELMVSCISWLITKYKHVHKVRKINAHSSQRIEKIFCYTWGIFATLVKCILLSSTGIICVQIKLLDVFLWTAK